LISITYRKLGRTEGRREEGRKRGRGRGKEEGGMEERKERKEDRTSQLVTKHFILDPFSLLFYTLSVTKQILI